MKTYFGSRALATYQETSLADKISRLLSDPVTVFSRFVHFVDCDAAAFSQEEPLRKFLEYGEPVIIPDANTQLFLVVPRMGTTSPWSSKASDILANAGLDQVKRIERGVAYYVSGKIPIEVRTVIAALLHDRMVETVLYSDNEAAQLFDSAEPRELDSIQIIENGKRAIEEADSSFGLALAPDEITYLTERFTEIGRNPTDAELMMFSVVNSEHCRHKVFNASWNIDGADAEKSLFKMIKNTYENFNEGVKSAYHDNAAVLSGNAGELFFPDEDQIYKPHPGPVDIVIKVETHNHPTAIAPVPGAATGSGGEIRDEGATGRGGQSKAGLTGFSVSNLHIPSLKQPWEEDLGKPDRLVSSLEVMLDGPIGGAAFNNEFGRPNLTGYFRSFQHQDENQTWGYHKPIMIAGGLGAITPDNVDKKKIQKGDKLIVLGGPAMLIGLGGGAASSVTSGAQNADLDFASVQRHNPEMQRRCQEVINSCWRMGSEKNPIVSIHDVGAGGLSNALPELVHDAELGANIELRKIPNDDLEMSPMQIWSNEAQERYVIAINPADVDGFKLICERERCPYAVVGEATGEPHLLVTDSLLGSNVVDVAMDVMFGKPPKMELEFQTRTTDLKDFDPSGVELEEAINKVLQHPSVADKGFLINIGDRTVGGMTARDQFVGPWQVPVSDVAVSHNSFSGYAGEAMAMGERSPVAVVDAAASGRLAVGEAITNILSADIQNLSDIKLSANWMVAVDADDQAQALFETVKAVGEEFCPALNLTIPVGKDSTSMRAHWEDQGQEKSVVSPLSLVITGYAPVKDVRKTVTPQLTRDQDTALILLPVSEQLNLGGSILSQVFNKSYSTVPDVEPADLAYLFRVITSLKESGKVIAYHDRSDGGLFTTLCEMAFAGNIGLDIDLHLSREEALTELFNESLGVVIQVRESDVEEVLSSFSEARVVARPNSDMNIKLNSAGVEVYAASVVDLRRTWSITSYNMQSLRDNPECADEEHQTITESNPGLRPDVTFDIRPKLDGPNRTRKFKVAVLREQGVNGQVEMAAAFNFAGFESVDVHMSDLRSGMADLSGFAGLAVGGGFSYGDVLSAGAGWAKSILFDESLREMFATFFNRQDTFTLGLCNGCQVVSHLKEIIPGAHAWPTFVKNRSQQFEARLSTLEMLESPSIFFKGMAGSKLIVPLAHGEGRAQFEENDQEIVLSAARFVDNDGNPTEHYPYNPNGSPDGLNAFTSEDGRATILMPHPERAFRSSQLSWYPEDWAEESPWMQMFHNAYDWASAQI